jgi:tRNA1(Val) A37 N6-methylase TrmN6
MARRTLPPMSAAAFNCAPLISLRSVVERFPVLTGPFPTRTTFVRMTASAANETVSPVDSVGMARSRTSKSDGGGYTRRERDAWCASELEVLAERLRPSGEETLDLILRAKVFLLQHRKGFRANTDSLTLAYYAWSCLSIMRERDPLRKLVSVDLGSANGLVSLLVGLRSGRSASMHLVELQEQLANRASRNLEINGLYPEAGNDGHKIEIHHHDLQYGLPIKVKGSADVVLMNPPFYSPNTRTPPSNDEKVSMLSQVARLPPPLTLQRLLTKLFVSELAFISAYRAYGDICRSG